MTDASKRKPAILLQPHATPIPPSLQAKMAAASSAAASAATATGASSTSSGNPASTVRMDRLFTLGDAAIGVYMLVAMGVGAGMVLL